MKNGKFYERLKSFREEGELTAFNLACVAEALDIVSDLKEKNVGGETVEKRLGEFKSWDPEVFKVDKDAENSYRARLEERGGPAVLLSEEVERLEINPRAKGDLLYAVCDPFDGSYLFKRGIPDFWYSSLAFFGSDTKPRTCAVGDAVNRVIAFANEKGAFLGTLGGGGFNHRFQLNAEYRKHMGRKEIGSLEEASIESYAMKPKKYLLPLVDEFRLLMEPFKFFLPNGGPYGFVDVAEGKIDVYFARKQPFVDVFSGIFIAEQAGAIVTDFEGKSVRFVDNVKSVFDVVASTSEAVHKKVLERIGQCKRAWEERK